jgi:hypothetical protein
MSKVLETIRNEIWFRVEILGYDAFVVEADIIFVTEKSWSRFKWRSKSVIDNIASQAAVM